jgi:hypothetical protein
MNIAASPPSRDFQPLYTTIHHFFYTFLDKIKKSFLKMKDFITAGERLKPCGNWIRRLTTTYSCSRRHPPLNMLFPRLKLIEKFFIFFKKVLTPPGIGTTEGF